MGAGGFPIDLVLLGMVAAFLVLRLRGILGRRDGFEPNQGAARPVGSRPSGPVIDGTAEPVVVPTRPMPDTASPLGQTLAQMRRVDGSFDAEHFLNGAEAAFRLIVTEFAAGNAAALRPLLTDETFAIFEGAIKTREEAGETQTSEIRSIHQATIEAATLQGSEAEITVRFVSDQISQTLDRDGKHVSGADAVMELRDDWSFVRNLAHPGPAWRLAHARSA
ncbi:Tim44/TimA family putative adaptor protein [Acidisphaera sp. L21]|uniref:Tim44/TimA family putative adaptor protein n=1 Tax=Acidisphaera sp. L21 TaxID=1641851 RepID=UPI00131B6AFD|nr:Tim44/TimA family putative adaptor protein [Acidisphaera sp. L21]